VNFLPFFCFFFYQVYMNFYTARYSIFLYVHFLSWMLNSFNLISCMTLEVYKLNYEAWCWYNFRCGDVGGFASSVWMWFLAKCEGHTGVSTGNPTPTLKLDWCIYFWSSIFVCSCEKLPHDLLFIGLCNSCKVGSFWIFGNFRHFIMNSTRVHLKQWSVRWPDIVKHGIEIVSAEPQIFQGFVT